MAKIVTLGEIMLRLSPEGNDRFIQSDSFRIIPGGGEANVAVVWLTMVTRHISYLSCLSTRSVRLLSTPFVVMVSTPTSSLVAVTV